MKRHPFDTISFIFGLLFTVFGLTFLLSQDPWNLLFDSFSLGWLLPMVVLAGGAALLVSALRPDARAITDSPLTRSSPPSSPMSDTGGSVPGTPAVEGHPGATEEE